MKLRHVLVCNTPLHIRKGKIYKNKYATLYVYGGSRTKHIQYVTRNAYTL